jgi:ubiquitin C-terminal hydrolase
MDHIRCSRPYLETKDIYLSNNLDQDFKEWQAAQLKVENSPIVNELAGVKVSSKTCSNCGHKHFSFSYFHDLSLDIEELKYYNSKP